MKLSVSLLVILATVCVCSFASAGIVHVTDNIYIGANQLCLQGVPINPDPQAVFAGTDITVGDYPLYRWDAATQGQYQYDNWAPWTFGGMLLSDGYTLYSITNGSYSYDTLSDVDSMDVWVSLPKAGWSLIGNPYSYDYPWENVKVTDGNVTVSMQTAAKTNNWLQSVAFWWNAAEQSQYELGITEDWSNTTMMPVKHGIWVLSWVDKIALIMEAQQ
jgi:hypothetical protein